MDLPQAIQHTSRRGNAVLLMFNHFSAAWAVCVCNDRPEKPTFAIRKRHIKPLRPLLANARPTYNGFNGIPQREFSHVYSETSWRTCVAPEYYNTGFCRHVASYYLTERVRPRYGPFEISSNAFARPYSVGERSADTVTWRRRTRADGRVGADRRETR